jgi:hypothetical protein
MCAYRQGEAWDEVAQGLAEKQVKPIAADALLMHVAVQHKLHVAQEVRCVERGVPAGHVPDRRVHLSQCHGTHRRVHGRRAVLHCD